MWGVPLQYKVLMGVTPGAAGRVLCQQQNQWEIWKYCRCLGIDWTELWWHHHNSQIIRCDESKSQQSFVMENHHRQEEIDLIFNRYGHWGEHCFWKSLSQILVVNCYPYSSLITIVAWMKWRFQICGEWKQTPYFMIEFNDITLAIKHW